MNEASWCNCHALSVALCKQSALPGVSVGQPARQSTEVLPALDRPLKLPLELALKVPLKMHVHTDVRADLTANAVNEKS